MIRLRYLKRNREFERNFDSLSHSLNFSRKLYSSGGIPLKLEDTSKGIIYDRDKILQVISTRIKKSNK